MKKKLPGADGVRICAKGANSLNFEAEPGSAISYPAYPAGSESEPNILLILLFLSNTGLFLGSVFAENMKIMRPR